MKKMIGSAAILLACFLGAQLRQRERKERLALLRSLGTSLLALRLELTERRKTLGESFLFLAQKSENETVRCFYNGLWSDMKSLGERDFTEIWRSAAESCFSAAGDAICDALYPLGGCLGGSELNRQCAALETAAARIAEEERAEKEAMRGERRLVFGLSLCAGVFLVIILM